MLRPPTSSLPPLARLASYSTEQIDEALQNLRALYTKQPMPKLPAVAKALPKHLIHDTSVPDSGYASAEEDEDPCAASGDGDEADAAEQLEGLRSDPFEREFALRWLTAFAARSDAWVYDSGVPDEEDARAQLVDEAAALLASFAGDEDEEETALTRDFSFPGGVEVVLNDAPLDSQDHTSVGLQSWGSAIIFAERMCADPSAFGLAGHGLRVLELGAGTGLLSIAAAKLFEKSHSPSEIVATDYHPSVLENLRLNVSTNRAPIAVHALDWQSPCYESPFDAPFDVILAADVIYHPDHAQWIKNCVERLLLRPSCDADGGVFWLIIPVRSTGRHEGMGSTVKAVFPTASAVKASVATGEQLAILGTEEMGKLGGIGRADESGYTLFRIGWVTA